MKMTADRIKRLRAKLRRASADLQKLPNGAPWMFPTMLTSAEFRLRQVESDIRREKLNK